jgi:taurine dioxygenase
MQVLPLTAGFGAEALEVDLANLTDSDFDRLWQTWLDRHLLVVRGQSLTAAQFHTFAKRFGEPQPHVIDQFHHPEIADILVLSNVLKDGKPTGLQDGGTYFHTDYSYLAQPARCTTLYSIEVPERDGQRYGATLFADQEAAYEALSDDLKARIDPLIGLHHYGNREDLNQQSRTVASVLTHEQEEKMKWVRHRVARSHPLTGRKSLYAISGSSFGIEGMPQTDAVELLDMLKGHATSPQFQYALTYGVGDVVVWDNAALLHSATLTDLSLPRTLWRITVLEDLQCLESV